MHSAESQDYSSALSRCALFGGWGVAVGAGELLNSLVHFRFQYSTPSCCLIFVAHAGGCFLDVAVFALFACSGCKCLYHLVVWH